MKNKALFLDRDGIINIDYGYVYKKEDFCFFNEIFNICKKAIKENYKIIIITNQSGIARGMYSEEDFDILTKWMIKEFKNKNIKIDNVYYCPHHPTKGNEKYLVDCNCRKPKAGMIIEAQKKYNLNLQESIMIGDKLSDMNAAFKAGIKNRILISSVIKEFNDFDIKIYNSLKELILLNKKSSL